MEFCRFLKDSGYKKLTRFNWGKREDNLIVEKDGQFRV